MGYLPDCVAHGIKDIDEVVRRRLTAPSSETCESNFISSLAHVVNTPQVLVLPEIIPGRINRQDLVSGLSSASARGLARKNSSRQSSPSTSARRVTIVLLEGWRLLDSRWPTYGVEVLMPRASIRLGEVELPSTFPNYFILPKLRCLVRAIDVIPLRKCLLRRGINRIPNQLGEIRRCQFVPSKSL